MTTSFGKQGFGAMGLTAFYGPAVSTEHGVAVMTSAFNSGCRMFDTAQIYQQFGEQVPDTFRFNEELVGAFAAAIGRENIIIATKFFPRRAGFRSGPYQYSFELLEKETDASLARLGIDCIDLYYLHRMYPEDVCTVEQIAADMKKLVEAGKIKGYGLSEACAGQIRRAHAVHPISAIQQEWSLFARDLEEEIVPTAKELAIPIVAYSPVARGMLSGALTAPPKDWRATIPYLSMENIEANIALVAQVEHIAKGKNTTLAQICLAWVIAQGGIPIPGTTNIEHAASNQAASAIVLTTEEVDALSAATKGVQGMRGDPGYMKSTFSAQVKL